MQKSKRFGGAVDQQTSKLEARKRQIEERIIEKKGKTKKKLKRKDQKEIETPLLN